MTTASGQEFLSYRAVHLLDILFGFASKLSQKVFESWRDSLPDCLSRGALKVKTTLTCGLNFYMLEWRDAFRTFDWAGEYSNAQYYLEQINKLIALAR